MNRLKVIRTDIEALKQDHESLTTALSQLRLRVNVLLSQESKDFVRRSMVDKNSDKRRGQLFEQEQEEDFYDENDGNLSLIEEQTYAYDTQGRIGIAIDHIDGLENKIGPDDAQYLNPVTQNIPTIQEFINNGYRGHMYTAEPTYKLRRHIMHRHSPITGETDNPAMTRVSEDDIVQEPEQRTENHAFEEKEQTNYTSNTNLSPSFKEVYLSVNIKEDEYTYSTQQLANDSFKQNGTRSDFGDSDITEAESDYLSDLPDLRTCSVSSRSLSTISFTPSNSNPTSPRTPRTPVFPSFEPYFQDNSYRSSVLPLHIDKQPKVPEKSGFRPRSVPRSSVLF